MSRSLQNIGVVSLATVASRILGLVRDISVTAVFGASALASAFVTAFTLPNLFRRLLGEGALTAALVPTLNEALAETGKERAFTLVNQVATWLGMVTLGIVLMSMAGLFVVMDTAWLDQVASDHAQAARWRTAAQLAIFLFPYLWFVCLAAAFSAALQTMNRFLAPALSPIWLNVAMIGSLAVALGVFHIELEDTRMRWLCAGVLLGGFLQMVVPMVALVRAGWQPRVDFSLSPAIRAVLLLMGPTVLGSTVYLINLAVSRLIGLSLNESAAVILNLATRLIELPIGVFAVAVTTVVFPLISSHAAKGEWGAMARTYHQGMRLVLAINVPAAMGMAVLAAPIIRVLFERGQFRPEDTAMMVPVLGVFAAGLPFFAYVNLLLRAFYAEKDTRTPVKAAVISFVVNVGLSLALMGPFSTMGLALASNLAVVGQAIFLQRALTRQRAELTLRPQIRDLAKIMVATLIMGLMIKVGGDLTSGWGSDGVRLCLLIPLGAATFGGLVALMKLTDLGEMKAMIWDRRRGDRGERS